MAGRDPVADLRHIAFLLERNLESTYRVRAYRGAANALEELGADEVARRVADGTLTKIKGVGDKTAQAVTESLRGDEPRALTALLQIEAKPLPPKVAALRQALRGDCHSHSDWSDGGSPIREMAMAARDLGHDYLVLTDHSPRLTVANGLSVERLEQQLDVVAEVNDELAPFRLLTGIEVDILDDGTLDQKPSLLARLDLVVASVHSKLRMPAQEMTPRMVAAISNPHTDILGHCTGRMVMGARGTRPESEFDAEIVFAACAQFGVAVEINSRPERLDPPDRLIELARDAGCLFTIDTDAHAPGQLDWQPNGCEKAVACDLGADRIVNTRGVDDLLAWTADHSRLP
ncbi:MAG TPA: PHP domain-containing protein [Jatrophihabitans sp.]